MPFNNDERIATIFELRGEGENEILNLFDSTSASMDDLAATSARLGSEVQSLDDHLGGLARQAQELQELNEFGDTITFLTRTLPSLTDRVEHLTNTFDEYERVVEDAESATDDLEAQLEALRREVERQDALDDFDRRLKDATESSKDAKVSLVDLGREGLGGLEKGLEIATKALNVATEAASALWSAIQEGGSVASIAQEFERLGGTAEDMNALKGAVAGMMTENDAQRAFNVASALGLTNDQMEQFSAIVAGAKQRTGELNEVGAATVKLFQDFGEESDEIAEALGEYGIAADEVKAGAERAAEAMGEAFNKLTPDIQRQLILTEALALAQRDNLQPSLEGLGVDAQQAAVKIEELEQKFNLWVLETFESIGGFEALDEILETIQESTSELGALFTENKDTLIDLVKTSVKFYSGLIELATEAAVAVGESAAAVTELGDALFDSGHLIDVSRDAVKDYIEELIRLKEMQQEITGETTDESFIVPVDGSIPDQIKGIELAVKALSAEIESGLDQESAALKIESIMQRVDVAQEQLFDKISGRTQSELGIWGELGAQLDASVDSLFALEDGFEAAEETARRTSQRVEKEPSFFETYLGVTDAEVSEAVEAGRRASNVWLNEIRAAGEALISEIPPEDTLMAKMIGFAGLGEGESFVSLAKEEISSLADELVVSFERLEEEVELERLTDQVDELKGSLDGLSGVLSGNLVGNFAQSIGDTSAAVVESLTLFGDAGATGAEKFRGGLGVARAGFGAFAQGVLKDTKAVSIVQGLFETAEAGAALARYIGSYGTDGVQLASFLAHSAAAASYFIAAGQGGGGSGANAGAVARGGGGRGAGPSRGTPFASEEFRRNNRREDVPDLAPIIVVNPRVSVDARQSLSGLNRLARQDLGDELDNSLLGRSGSFR